MREIKFRAWVIRSEAMDKINMMRYEDNQTIFGWKGDGVTMEIMQFTGLMDKNGKEIYEGDVIKFKVDFPDAEFDNGVVRFAAGGHWTSQTEDDLEELLSEELKDLKGEVIGNIHEHPELLKSMTKDIKDYLPFYIGCDCLVQTEYGTRGPPKRFTGSLHGVYYDRWTTDGMELSLQVITEHGARWTYKPEQVTLLLRPLSDMTDEEKEKSSYRDIKEMCQPWELHYLLSKGFDIFNLIPEGLAIDAATIRKIA